MRAWPFQDPKQKAKHGVDKCPWSVGFYTADGKRTQGSIGTKAAAEKYQCKVEGELAAAIYATTSRVEWKVFRKEYEAKILPNHKPTSQTEIRNALDHFEKIVGPTELAAIRTTAIDEFIGGSKNPSGFTEGWGT